MAATYGPWAIIVGALHGVDAELARQLAPQGLNCVLLARRDSALQQLQTELQQAHGIQTRTVDLTTADDIGVASPQEVAEIGLGELANGPSFMHPQGELHTSER